MNLTIDEAINIKRNEYLEACYKKVKFFIQNAADKEYATDYILENQNPFFGVEAVSKYSRKFELFDGIIIEAYLKNKKLFSKNPAQKTFKHIGSILELDYWADILDSDHIKYQSLNIEADNYNPEIAENTENEIDKMIDEAIEVVDEKYFIELIGLYEGHQALKKKILDRVEVSESNKNRQAPIQWKGSKMDLADLMVSLIENDYLDYSPELVKQVNAFFNKGKSIRVLLNPNYVDKKPTFKYFRKLVPEKNRKFENIEPRPQENNQ